MMEELPSIRKDEGILEGVDATTEGATVEVQSEATQPLSQTSDKKEALHVPITMEKLIASTVEKKATGQTYVPFYLKNNSHSSKYTSLFRMKLPKKGTKIKKRKVASWESKWPY